MLRMTLILLVFSGLIGTGIGINLVNLRSLRTNAELIYEQRLISIDFLVEADRDGYQSNLALFRLLHEYINANPRADYQNLIGEVTNSSQRLLGRFNKFDELFGSVSAETDAQKLAFQDYYNSWNSLIGEILKKAKGDTNDVNQAFSLYYTGEYNTAFEGMSKQIDLLTGVSLDLASREYHAIVDLGKRTNTIYLVMIILIVAFSLAILALMYFVVRKPLDKANAMIQNISEGDGDLSQQLEITRKDELGLFASHFNSFIVNLRTIVMNIKTVAGNTIQAREVLASNSEEANASVTQIVATIKSINDQMQDLDGNISHTFGAINGISKNIKMLDENIENQSTMTEESTASVTQMISSIESVAGIATRREESTRKLAADAAEGKEILNNTVNQVQEINSNIDAIKQMTQIISGVAAKTNLLAMNAAIEAAHAGNAGKGFAVVADEIRKLAESSRVNAREIDNILKKIIAEIREAGVSSIQTRESYEHITSEIEEVSLGLSEINSSTQELKAGGRQMLDAMTELRGTAVAVRNQANQIQSASDTVNQSMELVKQISGSVSSAMSEMKAGTDEIIGSVSEVTNITEILGKTTEQLEKEIGRFST